MATETSNPESEKPQTGESERAALDGVEEIAEAQGHPTEAAQTHIAEPQHPNGEAEPAAGWADITAPHVPADVAESMAEGLGEAPDGQVVETPDDQADEASAVDPQIDLGLVEAYLFSTHSPLTAGRLAELFDLESTKPIRKAIRVLNEQYEQTRRCFRVEQVAGGFQLLTLPDFGEKLKALHQKEHDSKLTKAALETMAIIAYKQPILRAEVEAIRGVASGETIRNLMEKHLVKIAGRAEEPGRPILYGTTKRFLEVFGLNNLKDLPQPDSVQKQQAIQAALQPTPAEQLAEAAAAQEKAAEAKIVETIEGTIEQTTDLANEPGVEAAIEPNAEAASDPLDTGHVQEIEASADSDAETPAEPAKEAPNQDAQADPGGSDDTRRHPDE